MAISLVKGQKISLSKEAGTSLSKIIMGLGWDAVKKKGFLGFGGGSKDIDLDASCCLFDEQKQPVDVVWFKQLRSRDGSILHTGDNRTGEGDGDDEQILVDLSKVPPQVKYLVFTVNSFCGQTFDEIENAYCRIIDAQSNKEVAKYTLSGGGNFTAMVMAKLYRHDGEWKMHALGDSANGQVIEHLLPAMIATL